MEFYAKSPVFTLTEDKKRQLAGKIENVIQKLKGELGENDLGILEGYQASISNRAVEAGHKTLQGHLNDTVKCAEDFFGLYGNYFSEKEKMLILHACSLHDIGKANYIFQIKVNDELADGSVKDVREIPHGFLGAVILSKKDFLCQHPECDEDDFSVLLTAIYYHHNRPDIYSGKELEEYCRKYYLEYVKEYLNNENISIYPGNKNKLLFSDQNHKEQLSVDEELWCKYMLVKGMLNKFDWTVSAGYDRAEIAIDFKDKKLCHNVEKVLSGGYRPAQSFMADNRDGNVIVIAPTGSGKTEAALLWLNGEKGFYTLPLKVSSNAIYQRIKEKYEYKDVALLHSDSMNSYLLESPEDVENSYRNYEQAKLFSYPLTVCTVDQLFKFVYKALGTEIFAATLKYSKIVIDEIQSYSPKIVAALIFGLTEIKNMGGKFAIITATFPPVLKFFMKKNKLIEGRDYVYKDFSDTASALRHRVRVMKGDLDIDRIVEDASAKKILIICNTVSKAQKIYNEICDRCPETGLLHSRYIRADREILEKRIMEFSGDKSKTGIWVTTQIVEASLDIDFDILYTEMCTADSLLQRMGRCNRAGTKSTDEPNIIVYDNGAGRGKIYDKDIYDRSADLLNTYDGKIISETDKVNYMNQVYDIERIKKTNYYMQIENNLMHFRNLRPLEYDAENAKDDFRDIRSITVIPERIYNQNYDFIQEMKNFFNTPHVDKGIRQVLKSRLAALTMNLNIHYGIPNGIDKGTIGTFDIHRARLEYDFNGYTGRGLLLDKIEDEGFFV